MRCSPRATDTRACVFLTTPLMQTVARSTANSAPSQTLNKYKLKGYVIITAICGSTAAQCWHKRQKIILKRRVKKQGSLLSALDSSDCSRYVAYQLWATMHTLGNLGAPQNAGHSLNRYRALSISWTAKLRAGTCHPTEQALCFMTCTNVHRNTHKTIKHNTWTLPRTNQFTFQFELQRDQPIFYYCRFRSDECASVTQFGTDPFQIVFR